MAQVKVKLLRPLNGQDIGKVVTYDKADADMLAETGSVQILGPAKSSRQAPKTEGKKAPAPKNKALSGLQNKEA